MYLIATDEDEIVLVDRLTLSLIDSIEDGLFINVIDIRDRARPLVYNEKVWDELVKERQYMYLCFLSSFAMKGIKKITQDVIDSYNNGDILNIVDIRYSVPKLYKNGGWIDIEVHQS